MILDALERLLSKAPLRDLDVEQIAEAAGITRTRFYHYYKSKYEAYAALLRRIAGQVLDLYAFPGSWYTRDGDTRPRDALSLTMKAVIEVWLEHGPVLREGGDLWNAIPEIRDEWHGIMGQLVNATAATIERERELGVAPDGTDAHRLAQSLIWQGERLILLNLMDAPGAMDLDELLDVGLNDWMRSIYLADDPSPRRRLRRR
jgi:TetR/AcrR family transcriptional regulator, ethionamide resistance regulator